MNILVINAGSSSLKYQLYDMKTESVLAKGRVERIGMDSSILTHEVDNQPEVKEVSEILDHTTAIKKVLDMLTHRKVGVLRNITDIKAVGHRVVHGGESFSESVLIDQQVKLEIRKLFDLAPLHNDVADKDRARRLQGLRGHGPEHRAALDRYVSAVHVAVDDAAGHCQGRGAG